ncbi:hypothetical protein [Streptomyces sp. NPDC051014]|uniref:hypothetical protein n=1 Tax=Streptomyces sp. NPDC051014 TaxID=3155751 RepID=UPI0034081A93
MATELAGPGQAHGADPGEFCDTVFPFLDGSRAEVGFGPTAAPGFTERRAAEQRTFEAMADRFDVPVYRPDGRATAWHVLLTVLRGAVGNVSAVGVICRRHVGGG